MNIKAGDYVEVIIFTRGNDVFTDTGLVFEKNGKLYAQMSDVKEKVAGELIAGNKTKTVLDLSKYRYKKITKDTAVDREGEEDLEVMKDNAEKSKKKTTKKKSK